MASKKSGANYSGAAHESRNHLLKKFNDLGYLSTSIRDGDKEGYEIYNKTEKNPIAYIYDKRNIFRKKERGFRKTLKIDIESISKYIPEPEWLIYIPHKEKAIIIEYKYQKTSGSAYWKILGQAHLHTQLYKKIFTKTRPIIDYQLFYLISGPEIDKMIRDKKGDFLEIIRTMVEDLEVVVETKRDIDLEEMGFKKLK